MSAEKIIQAPRQVAQTQTQEETQEEKTQETIIASDSKTDDQLPTTARIINSAEFKQLIRSETIDHIENNPNSLANFADSFEIPVEEIPPDIETQISPLATGLTDVRRNGKVTCVSQLRLPFQNDFSNGLIVTTKDCTLPKKFVLNTK